MLRERPAEVLHTSFRALYFRNVFCFFFFHFFTIITTMNQNRRHMFSMRGVSVAAKEQCQAIQQNYLWVNMDEPKAKQTTIHSSTKNSKNKFHLQNCRSFTWLCFANGKVCNLALDNCRLCENKIGWSDSLVGKSSKKVHLRIFNYIIYVLHRSRVIQI